MTSRIGMPASGAFWIAILLILMSSLISGSRDDRSEQSERSDRRRPDGRPSSSEHNPRPPPPPPRHQPPPPPPRPQPPPRHQPPPPPPRPQPAQPPSRHQPAQPAQPPRRPQLPPSEQHPQRPTTQNGNHGNRPPNAPNANQEDTPPEFVNIKDKKRMAFGTKAEFPDAVELQFPLRQRQVMLNLTLNFNVKDTAEVILGTGPGKQHMKRWRNKGKANAFAVYTDSTAKASIIARQNTKNARKLRYLGSFFSGPDEYLLEPMDWSGTSTGGEPPLGYDDVTDVNMHLVHRLIARPSGDGYETDERSPYTTLPSYQPTSRGEFTAYDLMTGQANYGVQTLVVIDYALFEKWYMESRYQSSDDKMDDAIDNIRFYFAHVMNGVDMRYRSIDDPAYKMYVTLAGYYIATTRSAAPFTQPYLTPGVPHAKIDAYSAIDGLSDWLEDNKDSLPVHDQATLFTTDYLTSVYSGNRILGLSNIGQICTRYGVTLNRDEGLYSATQTGAHEMGHNLGALHDGDGNDCSSTSQYIMATYPVPLTDDTFRNAFTFSPCSISAIKNKMDQLNSQNANCLLDKAEPGDANLTRLLEKLPGEKYSPDEQCRVIFGLESFFCGGATEERSICRSMECFDTVRRYCRTSAEMRAAAGTTCGDKKWCQNGDCVYDANARSAKDYCIYGDYSGPYKNGLNCYIIGESKPWHCYNDYYLDDCCKTCAKIKDPTRPDCPYGDKNETCQNINPERDCLNSDINSQCCRTCEPYSPETGRCVDSAPWCPEYITTGRTCYYDTDGQCCATCQQYETGIEGCQYGDKASWCKNYIVKGSLCYRHSNSDCCASCQYFYTGIPGCEYGDKDGCPDYVTAKDCYTQDDVCCDTCRGLVVSDDPNCRYGDKEDFCLGMERFLCYTKSDVCCYQCNLYNTGVEGCEYGDRIRGCTASDCSDPVRRLDCCETCHSVATTPDPSCVDDATWCKDLDPSFCYGVEQEICCQRCSSFYTGKPGCEYGDHHSWCDLIYCQSSTLKQECCATCSNGTVLPVTTRGTEPTTTTTTTTSTTTTTTTMTTTTTPPELVCNRPDASWCYTSEYRVWPTDCQFYSDDGLCCNLCKEYYSGDPDCPFGDSVSWCSAFVSSAADCDSDMLEDCCQTCKIYV